MIDPELLQYARERIPLEIDEQNKRLSEQIGRITADFASRGAIRSSGLVLNVQEACVIATHERADLVWKILHRAITTIGITHYDGVEQDLKDFVVLYLPENMNGLKYRVQESARQIGMPDIISKMPDKIGNARNVAIGRLFSEIRLFVMTLKKAPVQAPYSSQFNFHNSTIGAVQAGNNSVANVSLQINGESRSSLIKALDIVYQELAKIDNLPGKNVDEIKELVEEGKAEISKEKPNQTKLSTYLPLIGDAIGVVANLKPAYEGLKSAAAMIGIPLP